MYTNFKTLKNTIQVRKHFGDRETPSPGSWPHRFFHNRNMLHSAQLAVTYSQLHKISSQDAQKRGPHFARCWLLVTGNTGPIRGQHQGKRGPRLCATAESCNSSYNRSGAVLGSVAGSGGSPARACAVGGFSRLNCFGKRKGLTSF